MKNYQMKCGNRLKFVNTVLATLLLLLCGCTDSKSTQEQANKIEIEKTEDINMKLYIDDKEVSVIWEDNKSVDALKELAIDDLTINMSMYGGFEQVGDIGVTLPSSDKRISTEPGDIVLYASDQIVLFYGSNTWSYTKLGKIEKTKDELKQLLGNGDVTIRISKN